MWNGFSKRCVRRGLTLIEVVAGIALLSTLLVAILMSYQAHAGQVRSAKRRLAAIEFADQQMSAWTSQRRLPEIGRRGESADGEFLWRVVSGASTEAQRFGLQVVRLEVLETRRDSASKILATVEFLTPMPKSDVYQ